MLQWFLRFSEFTEFNASSAPFRENSIDDIFYTLISRVPYYSPCVRIGNNFIQVCLCVCV